MVSPRSWAGIHRVYTRKVINSLAMAGSLSQAAFKGLRATHYILYYLK